MFLFGSSNNILNFRPWLGRIVFVHQTSPDNRTNIDTINILLSDEISGKWIGKGETDIREHLFVLKEKTKLKKGTHLLVFEIAMRYGNIPELKSISNISEIGFSIKKLWVLLLKLLEFQIT